VIGGTKEPNDWSPNASMATRDRLLQKACEMHPELGEPGDLKVVADIVGRRPARQGGTRIEVETKQIPGTGLRTVLHAYGAAGRGFEISWGVAEEVLSLAEPILREQE
jgi:D-amino-acid oxidase